MVKPFSSLPFLLLLASCGTFGSLDVFTTVSDFELTSQQGAKVRLNDLTGKVWIADTFFTTCTGPCPMMSARMRVIGQQLESYPDIRLVSFSVDPEHDTPDVLARYAQTFQARPDRWIFLTGTIEALNRVCADGLDLSLVTGDQSHSIRFALVDRKARVRGYYSSTDSNEMKRLVADAKALAGR